MDNNSQRMYKMASLGDDEAKALSTDNYSSISFWKGTLRRYRELIDINDNSINSPNSFHSIEDDREGWQPIHSRRHDSF